MEELSKDKIINFTLEVASSHNFNRSEIIGMLQEIQENYHYLPEIALNELSKCLSYRKNRKIEISKICYPITLLINDKYKFPALKFA